MPVIFWREGYDRGMSGFYVRGRDLNKAVVKWIEKGAEVAGILIDPENEANVDVLIYKEEDKEIQASVG